MYKVIKYFTDLHDNCYPYNVGDEFPRKGITVKQERLDELAGSKNRQGEPLIVLVEEQAEAVENADLAEASEVTDTTEQAEAVEEKAPEKKSTKRGAKKATE